MFNPFRSIIRIFAFVRKEVVEIFRQPRLLLTLVLGPFFILLLFGIGYRNKGRTLRTVFVVPPGDAMEKQVQLYAPKLGSQIQVVGIEHDLETAKSKLMKRRADLIVQTPLNAYETIRSNKPAVFRLYHNEIDPYQAEYIRFTGELYVDKLNRWLIASTVENKKGDVKAIRFDVRDLIQKTHELRDAVQQQQMDVAKQKRQEIIARLTEMEGNAGGMIASFANEKDQQKLRSAIEQLRKIRQDLQTYSESGNENPEQLAQAEKQLTALDLQMNEVTRIDTEVLLSPFRSVTTPIAREQPNLQEYFSPAVIILLLQHLAITLASLSIVREFQTGSVELFRVSPLLKGELLLGKYIGYLLVGSIVALALTVLLVRGLKMPMLGSWWEYGTILFALILSSLGIGFLVSLISNTDSQAIQFSMILLLLSIFFTGFLLNLDLLWRPVRTISWMLPATYGIRLLQDVMLRGSPANLLQLGILLAAGVSLFIFCAIFLSRKLAPQ
jgi:ABC-2 type transport system permease protein